jgi:hypothetical protein
MQMKEHSLSVQSIPFPRFRFPLSLSPLSHFPFPLSPFSSIFFLLPPLSYSSKPDAEVCAVCLDPLQFGVTRLLCKHSYHRHCIKSWLDVSPLCPLCKAVVAVVPPARSGAAGAHSGNVNFGAAAAAGASTTSSTNGPNADQLQPEQGEMVQATPHRATTAAVSPLIGPHQGLGSASSFGRASYLVPGDSSAPQRVSHAASSSAPSSSLTSSSSLSTSSSSSFLLPSMISPSLRSASSAALPSASLPSPSSSAGAPQPLPPRSPASSTSSLPPVLSPEAMRLAKEKYLQRIQRMGSLDSSLRRNHHQT